MTIAIKYDDKTGRVTNRYFDGEKGGDWVNTDDADWPTPDPGPEEVPEFYYDADSGEITVEMRQVGG